MAVQDSTVRYYMLLKRSQGREYCKISKKFCDSKLPAGSILHDIYKESKHVSVTVDHYKYIVSLEDPKFYLQYIPDYLEVVSKDTVDYLLAVTSPTERLRVYQDEKHLQNALLIQIGDCVTVNIPHNRTQPTGKLRYKGPDEWLPGIWFGVELHKKCSGHGNARRVGDLDLKPGDGAIVNISNIQLLHTNHDCTCSDTNEIKMEASRVEGKLDSEGTKLSKGDRIVYVTDAKPYHGFVLYPGDNTDKSENIQLVAICFDGSIPFDLKIHWDTTYGQYSWVLKKCLMLESEYNKSGQETRTEDERPSSRTTQDNMKKTAKQDFEKAGKSMKGYDDYKKIVKGNEDKIKQSMASRLSKFIDHLRCPLGLYNLTDPLSHKLNNNQQVDSLFKLLVQHDFLGKYYLMAFQKMSADTDTIDIMTRAIGAICGDTMNITSTRGTSLVESEDQYKHTLERKRAELRRYMITNVVEFRDQIQYILPGAHKQKIIKEQNEDKMVEILINTLIDNPHLAEGFINVFISMEKDQAANIVSGACGRVVNTPIQETNEAELSAKSTSSDSPFVQTIKKNRQDLEKFTQNDIDVVIQNLADFVGPSDQDAISKIKQKEEKCRKLTEILLKDESKAKQFYNVFIGTGKDKAAEILETAAQAAGYSLRGDAQNDTFQNEKYIEVLEKHEHQLVKLLVGKSAQLEWNVKEILSDSQQQYIKRAYFPKTLVSRLIEILKENHQIAEGFHTILVIMEMSKAATILENAMAEGGKMIGRKVLQEHQPSVKDANPASLDDERDLHGYQRYLDNKRQEIYKHVKSDAFDILERVAGVVRMKGIRVNEKIANKQEATVQIVDILINHKAETKQFITIFDSLKKKKVSTIIKQALEEDKKNAEVPIMPDSADEACASILRTYQYTLKQCLAHKATVLIRELTQFKVLTRDDREKISKTPPNERVEQILKLIQNMNKTDFETFLVVLNKIGDSELSQVLREAEECLWNKETKDKKDKRGFLQKAKDKCKELLNDLIKFGNDPDNDQPEKSDKPFLEVLKTEASTSNIDNRTVKQTGNNQMVFGMGENETGEPKSESNESQTLDPQTDSFNSTVEARDTGVIEAPLVKPEMVEVTVGSKVKTYYYGKHYYGTLLWKGNIEGKTFAGIELEEVVAGGHDGSHSVYGNRFQCPVGRGIYISQSLCKPDDRDLDSYGRVNFEVEGWGHFWICGDCKELGNWDRAKSLCLRRKSNDSHVYVGTAWLPTNQVIQWKMCSLFNDKITFEDDIENRILYLKPGHGLTTKASWNIDTQIQDSSIEKHYQVSNADSPHSQDMVRDTDPVDTSEGSTQLLDVGSSVEVMWQRQLCYGVIRWVGDMNSKKLAGIELDAAVNSGSNGTIHNRHERYKFFDCEDYHGIYVPISTCKADSRFLSEPVENQEEMYFGPKTSNDYHRKETVPTELRLKRLGRGNGIQGHHNSCYLDASLYCMFAFCDLFDGLLLKRSEDTITQKAQEILKHSIVYPLRKDGFVSGDKVLALRTLLDGFQVQDAKSFTMEEKDPEEFLNALLRDVLKAKPFLLLGENQDNFLYQVFLEQEEFNLPTTDQLLRESFKQNKLKLREAPKCLILQMPRSGNHFKMYKRIFPSSHINITDLLDTGQETADAPRCFLCDWEAFFECVECKSDFNDDRDGVPFCYKCSTELVHNHPERKKHKPMCIKPKTKFDAENNQMELFAVLCISISHYVAFVNFNKSRGSQWLFFDSMADRIDHPKPYNVPEVTYCEDLPDWLSDDGYRKLLRSTDEAAIPPSVRRLLSDAYICFYRSVNYKESQV